MGFTKLDSKITSSSLWTEPLPTRIVFITMLSMADKFGFVATSRSGLLRFSNVPEEDFNTAIKALESPDTDSRSEDFEGRRIEKVEGGWKLLNYIKYREWSYSESEDAIRKRDYRNRKKEPSPHTPLQKKKNKTEAEAECPTDVRDMSQTVPLTVPEKVKTEERTSSEPNRRNAYDCMRDTPIPATCNQDLNSKSSGPVKSPEVSVLTKLLTSWPKSKFPTLNKLCKDILPEAISLAGGTANLLKAGENYKLACLYGGESPQALQYWLGDQSFMLFIDYAGPTKAPELKPKMILVDCEGL
jgi:hypothetical protein